MNTEKSEIPVQTESAESVDSAPVKKRTRTRKPASDVTADAVSGQEAAPDATDAVSEAAAPAPRKPRARKPVAADSGADAGAANLSSSADVNTAAEPAAANKVADPAPVAAMIPAGDLVAVSSQAQIAESAGVAGESDADAGPAGERSEAGNERRNRRRGRRGGGRGDGRTEGAADGREGDSQDVAADGVPAERASRALPVPTPDAVEVFASLLAGEFDGDDEVDAVAEDLAEEGADKRVLLPDVDAPKLHKVLAQSGVGSRRDMEQMIQEGRVSVNDEVAHTGMRISFGDRITIDGKPVRVRIAPPPARVIAYHKPAGEVVSHDDPQQRPTVFRKLPRLSQGKWQSVGRLDINTEGLLLFTNSGDLANKLMHPRFGVEREYAVRVLGTLEKPAKERLLAGVDIEGQTAAFKSVEDGGGEGVNRWYRVVITEGRNREVRRLFDAVGLTVSRLIRIRYGCVVLPRGLKRGACVDLGETDVKALRLLTGSGVQQPRGDRGEARPEGRGDGRNDNRKGGRNDGPAEGRRDGRQDGRQDARGERRGDGRQDARTAGPDRGRAEPRRDGKPGRGGQGGPGPNGPNARRQGGQGDRPPRDDAGHPRGPRREREASDAAPFELREPGDPSRIPNPLQQTYDKRAIQRERSGPRNEDEFENGPIPNPLQQTYDRRFVQNGRGGGNAGGGGQRGRGGKPGKGGEPHQPDPMQTSVGYIGADAFTRKSGGRSGGGGGGRRGGR